MLYYFIVFCKNKVGKKMDEWEKNDDESNDWLRKNIIIILLGRVIIGVISRIFSPSIR